MFGDMKFDEKCDCGGSISFIVQDVAKERTIRCSRGCSVKLTDDGGGAQKGTRDLDRALDKLSRDIRF